MADDKNVKKKGFWKGMKSELKKVIWPTGEQTVKSTFATITFVILVSLVLIVFNLAFNWLSNLWIKSLSHEDVIDNVVTTSGDISGEESNGVELINEQTEIENVDENEENDETVVDEVEENNEVTVEEPETETETVEENPAE